MTPHIVVDPGSPIWEFRYSCAIVYGSIIPQPANVFVNAITNLTRVRVMIMVSLIVTSFAYNQPTLVPRRHPRVVGILHQLSKIVVLLKYEKAFQTRVCVEGDVGGRDML